MGCASARRAGEALAAAYLELSGCRVVERATCGIAGVEVDLRGGRRPDRVLVEVKFRGRRDFGGAAAAVDRAKQERLRRAARALRRRVAPRCASTSSRSSCTTEGARLRHYRNAIVE